MTLSRNGALTYRAHRLRFIVAALFLVPVTAGMGVLAFDGLLLADPAVRNTWLLIVLGPVYLWLNYVVIVKIVSPPTLTLSSEGVRWDSPILWEGSRSYKWPEIDEPVQALGTNGVPLLQMIVKATGREIRLPPSHFGATYDEMAAAVTAARSGASFSPKQWRSQHPQHPLKHWLQEWGIALIGGMALALFVSKLRI